MKTNRVEVMEQGGKWLGTTRSYLQRKAQLGEYLTWASEDMVRGLTVSDIEMMVASAVAADRNERW